jgi:hypothetical protein
MLILCQRPLESLPKKNTHFYVILAFIYIYSYFRYKNEKRLVIIPTKNGKIMFMMYVLQAKDLNHCGSA